MYVINLKQLIVRICFNKPLIWAKSKGQDLERMPQKAKAEFTFLTLDLSKNKT